MQINHSTTVENLFLIWKSGQIVPQPYIGGDSILKKGEVVTFVFRGERRLSFMPVTILLPASLKIEEGKYRIWYDWYGNYQDEGRPESWEKEWYVRENVSLDVCTVVLAARHELELDFDQFQGTFFPHWDEDFNPYSDENEAELREFWNYLNSLGRDEQ